MSVDELPIAGHSIATTSARICGSIVLTPGQAGDNRPPPAFDPDRYAGRNVVERCFNRLKQFRDLATRYAKRAAYYVE